MSIGTEHTMREPAFWPGWRPYSAMCAAAAAGFINTASDTSAARLVGDEEPPRYNLKQGHTRIASVNARLHYSISLRSFVRW